MAPLDSRCTQVGFLFKCARAPLFAHKTFLMFLSFSRLPKSPTRATLPARARSWSSLSRVWSSLTRQGGSPWSKTESSTTSNNCQNHSGKELTLEYYFFILVIKALCVPAVNKVSGYCIKSLTALANKPPTMQIFPHSKFGINQSTGLKVMTKKFIFVQNNFLAITFKPVDQSIPNFECEKICMVGGLFANAVKRLMQ